MDLCVFRFFIDRFSWWKGTSARNHQFVNLQTMEFHKTKSGIDDCFKYSSTLGQLWWLIHCSGQPCLRWVETTNWRTGLELSFPRSNVLVLKQNFIVQPQGQPCAGVEAKQGGRAAITIRATATGLNGCHRGHWTMVSAGWRCCWTCRKMRVQKKHTCNLFHHLLHHISSYFPNIKSALSLTGLNPPTKSLTMFYMFSPHLPFHLSRTKMFSNWCCSGRYRKYLTHLSI